MKYNVQLLSQKVLNVSYNSWYRYSREEVFFFINYFHFIIHGIFFSVPYRLLYDKHLIAFVYKPEELSSFYRTCVCVCVFVWVCVWVRQEANSTYDILWSPIGTPPCQFTLTSNTSCERVEMYEFNINA